MKRRFLIGFWVIFLIGSILISSCSNSSTTSSTQAIQPQLSSSTANTSPSSTQPLSTSLPPAPVSTSAQSHWWDKFGNPQYGGTLNVRANNLNQTFDPAQMMGGGPWLETLVEMDWTTDPSVWAFRSFWLPIQHSEGWLAESWEVTDPQTVTVKLRQGIDWQNKAPVNGRELTADDVQFNYDRILGTGNGFTQANPFFAQQESVLNQVVATDKYTLQFKFKSPVGPLTLDGGLSNGVFEIPIVPPEWVALGNNSNSSSSGASETTSASGPPGVGSAAGPLSDWHTVVGTGAWQMTNLVSGSTMTLSKNPDYWGHDERYPQNQLPYADQLNIIQIPDISTSIAALRTGKIDMIVEMNGGLELRDGLNIEKTDPEIQLAWQNVQAAAITLRCDTKPFTDINVRKALQLSVDVPSIGKNYYQGKSPGEPVGLINPEFSNWTLSFNKWPADLQAEYSYNPDQAKKLLSDAGYPDGFKTHVVAPSMQDLNLLQILQADFKAIGVEMAIDVMDPNSYMSFTAAGKADQMVYFDGGAGGTESPALDLGTRASWTIPIQNQSFNNDKTYDALVNKMITATSITDAEKYSVQAELYELQQHWSVNSCVFQKPFAWQPWIKGYSGETRLGSGQAFYLARIWIDQSLKQ